MRCLHPGCGAPVSVSEKGYHRKYCGRHLHAEARERDKAVRCGIQVKTHRVRLTPSTSDGESIVRVTLPAAPWEAEA